MTTTQLAAKNVHMKEYYRIKADKKLLDRTITYNIFGKDVTLPKGFTLGTGTGLIQNKKSIEEGFKILEEWFKNPTPENWTKLFGNRLFGRQIRSYLLGEEISTRKGTGLNPAGKKLFDTLKVKELIPKDKIDKIDALINNVGISGPTGKLEDLDINNWKETIDININSHFL